MVLLQDWSSDERLRGPLDPAAQELGRMPELPTNRRLEGLLREHFGLALSDIYATNLFPFVKLGSMTSRIPMSDLVRAAREYALPQIEILDPAIVVCLGKTCFNALRKSLALPPAPILDHAIGNPFKVGRTEVWCQAHTGAIGVNNRNRGGMNRVAKDWARMAASIGSSGRLHG
jgi:restriction system protein